MLPPPLSNRRAHVSRKEFRAIVSFLVRIAWNHHPVAFLPVIGLSLTGAGVFGLQVLLQKRAVELMTLPAGAVTAPSFLLVAVLITGQHFTGAAQSLFGLLNARARSLIQFDLTFALRRRTAEAVSRLPLEVFERQETLSDLLRAQQGAEHAFPLLSGLLQVGESLVSLVSLLGALSLAHWSLPLALAVSAIPGFGLVVRVRNRQYMGQIRRLPEQREADYTYRLLFHRQAVREIRSFLLDTYLLERWARLTLSLRTLRLRYELQAASANLLSQAILAAVSTGVALFMAYGISSGKLHISDYVALTGSVLLVQSTIGRLGMAVSDLYEHALQVKETWMFLPAAPPGMEPVRSGAPFPAPLAGGIEVDRLTYQYPGSPQPQLREVSFRIAPGERVALVGGNGAGKTTLALCLLRLLSPVGGEIRYGGTALSALDERSFRKNVTAVFQEFVRYQYTTRENVGFGDLEALNDQERLDSVAARVGLVPVLQRLAHGWETHLGNELREGQDLSGGEWQRVAVARAWLRDAQVVVLDEPTAALDPLAEMEVFKEFALLSRGRTAIMISHRLGPARFADRILVLHEGRLVEQGSHAELLSQDGHYAAMFRAQAKWYV